MQQNSRKRPLSVRDIENSNATAQAMLGSSIAHHSWMQPEASISASTLPARNVRPPRQRRPSVLHVETSSTPPVAPTASASSDQDTEGASSGLPVPTRRPTVTMPMSPYGFLPSPAPSEDNPNPYLNPSKSPHQPLITPAAPIPTSATSSPNLQSMSMPSNSAFNPAPNSASPLAANFVPNTVPHQSPVSKNHQTPVSGTAALPSPIGQNPPRLSVWYLFTPAACLPRLSDFMTSNVRAMNEPEKERFGLLHDAITQNDWVFMMLSNILSLYVVDEKSLAPYSPPLSHQALTLANSILLYNGTQLSQSSALFLASFPASLPEIRASLGDKIFLGVIRNINLCFQQLTTNLENVVQTGLQQETLPLLRDLVHILKIRSRVFQRAAFRYILFRIWGTDSGEYVESAMREFMNEQQRQKPKAASQSQYTVYNNLYNQHRQSIPTVNSPFFVSPSMNSPSASLPSNDPTPRSRSQNPELTVAQGQAQLQARHFWEQQARQQVAAALQPQQQTQQAQYQNPLPFQHAPPQPQQQVQQPQHQNLPQFQQPQTQNTLHCEQPQHQNPLHQQPRPQHQNPRQFQQPQNQNPLHFQQPQYQNSLHFQPRALPYQNGLAMMNQNIMSNISSRRFNQNVALNQPTTPNSVQLQQQRTPFFPAMNAKPLNQLANPTPQTSTLHHAHLRSPVLRPRARVTLSRSFRRPAGFALPPVKLTTNPIQNFHFTLSDDQLQQTLKLEPGIHGSPPSGTFDDSTITCRLRCCPIGEDSDLPQENQWILLDGYWPTQTYFHLNGEALEPRHKLHHGRNLPIDLTKYLKAENDLTVSVLRTSTDPSRFDYAISVEIIRFSQYETIKQECLNTRLVPSKDVLDSIKSSLAYGEDDDEIAIMHSNVIIKLFEPFTNAKIFDIPARGQDCKHREAFDLDTFLETRDSNNGVSKTDVWRCPICRLDCRPDSILIDGFLMDVREELAAKNMLKTRSIVIESDGSWIAKPEAQDGDDDDDGDDDEEQETGAEVTRRRRVSVISLDD